MKYTLWMMAALISLTTVQAHAQDKPKTKGVDKAFVITAPFSAINIVGSFDVTITDAPITSVTARGDLPDLDLVNAVVIGNTLQISENAAPLGVKIKELKAKMTIALPSFNGLDASGSGKVTVKNMRAGDFTVAQRGRNELTFENVKFSNLNVSVINGSRIELSGRCDALNVEAIDGGTINASDLRCDSVNARLGADGNVSVRANDKIVARLDGTGSLKVKGKPSDIDVTLRSRSDVDFEN
jgi:hypothetical protein